MTDWKCDDMKNYSNYYPSSKDFLHDSGGILFNIQQQNALNEGTTVTIDGVTSNVIIQEHTNPYGENREERILHCLENVTIHRGSMIYWKNEYWLVMTDIDFNGIYKSSKMVKCTNTLTFKNKNGVIIHQPVVLANQTVLTDGIKETARIVDFDTMRFALVPFNNDTKELYLQQRFMLNHNSAFEILKIDDYTYCLNSNGYVVNGVLQLTLNQGAIIAEDDIVNNLAYNDNLIITPIVTGATIIVSGQNLLKIGEQTTYSVKYDDGKPIIGTTYTFSTDSGKASIISSGSQTCLVKGLFSGQVQLTAMNNANPSITYKKIINVQSGF